MQPLCQRVCLGVMYFTRFQNLNFMPRPYDGYRKPTYAFLAAVTHSRFSAPRHLVSPPRTRLDTLSGRHEGTKMDTTRPDSARLDPNRPRNTSCFFVLTFDALVKSTRVCHSLSLVEGRCPRNRGPDSSYTSSWGLASASWFQLLAVHGIWAAGKISRCSTKCRNNRPSPPIV